MINTKKRIDYKVKKRFLVIWMVLVMVATNCLNTVAMAGSESKEVFFIEDNLTEYQILVDNLHDYNKEVVIIDAQHNGLEQIAQWAKNHTDYDAIHVLSHGLAGTLQLGSVTLTNDSLTDATIKAELTQLGNSLTEDGDLLLYGCNVAADEEGKRFVDNLGLVTGADVAASEDLTGSSDLGGDWQLEYFVGKVDNKDYLLSFEGYYYLLGGVTNATFGFEANTGGLGTKTVTQTVSEETLSITATADDIFDTSSTSTQNINGSVTLSAGYFTFETQLVFNVSGKIFDFGSITIFNVDAYNKTFTFTASNGKTYDVLIPAGETKTVDLSANSDFYGISSVTLTASNPYAMDFDDVVLNNIKEPDTTAPTMSTLSPLDNATNVGVNDNPVLTFDENVKKGTGNIVIKKTANNNTVESFDVASSALVTGWGTNTITINPTSALAGETEYYVQIDATAFDDTAGNSYVGITDTTSWSFTTADVNAPIISTLSPTNGATNIGVNDNIVLTFSENVVVGTGNIVIKKTSDNSTLEIIDVISGQVTGGGTNTITVNPSITLPQGMSCYVQIAASAFRDGASNSYAGIANTTSWNFTTIDTTNPTVSTLSPLDNATNVGINDNLIITFDENVVVGTGSIIIKKTSDNSTVETVNVASGQVTGGGTATITINPTTVLTGETGYYVQIASTAFGDTSGNSYAGITDTTSWSFTTADVTAPTISTLSPADNATNVGVNANLVITFNENVVVGTGNIIIKKASDNSILETIDVTTGLVTGSTTNTITINPSTTLPQATNCYVEIQATAFEDMSGNSYAGFADAITWNFTTIDSTAPTVSTLSPLDNAINIGVNSNLVLTFDENVVVGTGNIVIKKTSDNSTIETIDVTSGQVTGTGTATITVNPTSTLAGETAYYIQIAASAFDDTSGNSYAGIADTTSWSFTTADITAPLLSSVTPIDNATNVGVNSNLVITFNENVVVGTGNIIIKKVSDDTILETIDVTSGLVTGGGTNIITVNPSTTLPQGTNCYVEIQATAFDDASGNSFAGIANTTTWNFTTEDTTAPTISTINPTNNATGVGVNSNLILTFNENVVVGTGNIVIKKSSDNTTLESIDVTSGQVTGGGTTTITVNPTPTFDEVTEYYVQIDATAFDDASGNSYAGIANTTSWSFTTADATAPTISSLSPADNATNVGVYDNLVITFSETVVVGTGNIVIKKVSDNTILETIDITSGQVIGGGTNTITVNPNVILPQKTNCYVEIQATAFDDTTGNSFAGISDKTTWNFMTEDTTAPTINTLSPVDNAIGVGLSDNLVLTFNETVVVGTGNIIIKKSSDNSTVETIEVSSGQVTGGGTATITVNPASAFGEVTAYYVQIDATVFDDEAGNSYAGIADTTSWSFTTADATAPTISALSPTDNASNVGVTDNLVITFSENVVVGTGSIMIKKSSDDTLLETIVVTSGQVTGGGTSTITIDPGVTLPQGTNCYVKIASTAFEDSTGNDFAGITDKTTWNFTTIDTTDPTISSLSPTDDATGVGINDNLVITFNENVVVGTGNVVIKKVSDNSVVESIDVTGAKVSGSGTSTITINPSTSLNGLAGYYVQIDATAFDDAFGNSFAGIADTTSWNFTTGDATAPTISTLSPLNNAVNIGVNENLVLTFSENVVVGTGNVKIKKVSDNSIVEIIDVTSGLVSGSGSSVITINPNTTFEQKKRYYVVIDATAFDDVSGNDFAGISSNATWSFTTVDTTAPTISTLSPIDDVIGVGINDNLVITFDENVVVKKGNIVIKKASDNSVVETIDVTSERVSGNGTNTITINPNITLEEVTAYYIQIDVTAFDDESGNSHTGISDKTTWNFTTADVTAPKISSLIPKDGKTKVELDDDLVIGFNETVVVGSGKIIIKKYSDNSIVETIKVMSNQVKGSGTKTITINPKKSFDSKTNYYVLIDQNAFIDTNGNYFSGILSKTTWNFMTKLIEDSTSEKTPDSNVFKNNPVSTQTSTNKTNNNTINNTSNNSTNRNTDVNTTDNNQKDEPRGATMVDENGAVVKIGWTDIYKQIDDKESASIDNTNQAEAGFYVKAKGDSVIPKEVLQLIQNKGVTLTVEVDDGITWVIDGKNITAKDLADINLEVKKGDSEIPKDIAQELMEGKVAIEVELTHNGKFGFDAELVFFVGKENVGQQAVLYYYNEQSEEMEYVHSDDVNQEGYATFVMNHASSYLVVLENTSTTEPVAENNITKDEQVTDVEATTEDTNIPEKEDKNSLLGVIGVLLIVGVVGCSVLWFARRKKEEQD